MSILRLVFSAGLLIPSPGAAAGPAPSDAGCAALVRGDHAAAVRAFDEAVRREPFSAELLRRRAVAKFRSGDREGAAADFRVSLLRPGAGESAGGSPDSPLCGASFNRELKKLARTRRGIDRLKARGIALFLDGKHGAAVRKFDKAVAADPSDPETYVSRAVALENLARTSPSAGRAGDPLDDFLKGAAFAASSGLWNLAGDAALGALRTDAPDLQGRLRILAALRTVSGVAPAAWDHRGEIDSAVETALERVAASRRAAARDLADAVRESGRAGAFDKALERLNAAAGADPDAAALLFDAAAGALRDILGDETLSRGGLEALAAALARLDGSGPAGWAGRDAASSDLAAARARIRLLDEAEAKAHADAAAREEAERKAAAREANDAPTDGAGVEAAAYALKSLERSESKFNVKCVTSFEAAHQALAGKEFFPGTALKREVLIRGFGSELLDGVLTLQRLRPDGLVPDDGVKEVFHSLLYAGLERDKRNGKWSVHIQEPPAVQILDEDIELERHLSEGWRALFAVLQLRSPPASPLLMPAAALDRMSDLLSFYDLVLLRFGARLAGQNGRPRIAPVDLEEAARRLRRIPGEYSRTGDPQGLADETWLRFYSIVYVESKIRAIQAVNREVDGAAALAHLGSIAGSGWTREAQEELALSALPRIARAVWLRAQEGMGKDEPLITGRAMADAVADGFPFRIGVNEEVEFFPSDPEPIRVYAFEADSLRDAPLYYRVVRTILKDGLVPRPETRSEGLWASPNPYAIDQLTELLSTLSVPLIKEAASRAREAGREAATGEDVQAAAEAILARARWGAEKEKPQAEEPGPRPAPKKRVMAEPAFVDVTALSGMRTADAGRRPEDDALEKKIRGFAVLDFDNDGLPDVFFCDGRLLRNRGGFQFSPVPAASSSSWTCRGAASADYDNDGWADILLLGSGPEGAPRLLRNAGGERFEDVTEAAGIPRVREPGTSAVWFDYDRDGFLDAYILNWGRTRDQVRPTLGNAKNGAANRLFRNRGDGSFEETTQAAGVGDTGWALAGAAFDYDNDGRPDLYVANDFGRSILYRNRGDGTFEDVSLKTKADSFGHAMGVSVADFDRDGFMDLFITNIGMYNPATRYIRADARTPVQFTLPFIRKLRVREANRLYRNVEGKRFEDVYENRVEPAPTGWGWSGMFLDYDNDCGKDLYIVNGFEKLSLLYNMERKVLFRWNAESGKFEDASAGSGADFAGNSRGSAFADFDRDGRVDLLVSGLEGARLLKNAAVGGHWIGLKLAGRASNRDGIGARIKIEAGGCLQYADFGTEGGGFSTNSERTALFGLGAADRVDALEIRWPSGAVQKLDGVAADRYLVVEEKNPP